MIVIISGPSCVGKTTIVDLLSKRNPEWCKVINYTTRPKRDGEISGQHYHFISQEQFLDGVRQSKFAEYDTIYGHYYGISNEDVGDHRGAVLLMILFTDSITHITIKHSQTISIFVMPEKFSVLQDRMILRGVKEPQKAKRLDSATYEMKNSHKCDFVVVNNSVDKCCSDIEGIVAKKRWATL